MTRHIKANGREMTRHIKANGRMVATDALLTALYNGSAQLGMGLLQADGDKPINRLEAQVILQELENKIGSERFTFDYLRGRLIKVHEGIDGNYLLTGEVDGRLYDRDWGEGAFDRAVDEALRMESASDGGYGVLDDKRAVSEIASGLRGQEVDHATLEAERRVAGRALLEMFGEPFETSDRNERRR